MPASDWATIIVAAGAFLAGEYIFGMGAFFSPGWANGWPFGLSFQTVLSTAITGWISVMFMTAAIGAGAMVGLYWDAFDVERRRGRRVYYVWLGFAAVATLGLSIRIFSYVYSSVWKDFPNGYNIR